MELWNVLVLMELVILILILLGPPNLMNGFMAVVGRHVVMNQSNKIRLRKTKSCDGCCS